MTKGFAGVKFSGSPRRLGENMARVSSGRNMRINPSISFSEK